MDFEWDLKSAGSPTIWNLDKWMPFYQKPYEIQTKMSGFQMFSFRMVVAIAITIAKARPFDNQTIWNPALKKSGFQMVGFQIPTVFRFWLTVRLNSRQVQYYSKSCLPNVRYSSHHPNTKFFSRFTQRLKY